MNRVLKLADYWYGEETRRHVFEPLLADYTNEVRGDRSLPTRLRWWWAIVTTFAVCVPRALSAVPLSLAIDLALRAAAFAAMSLAVQWSITSWSHRPNAVPISMMTTLPFAVLPVIWRIRVSDLPPHRSRLAAIAVALVAAAVNASNPVPLAARVTLAIQILIVASVGWRLGDPAFYNHGNIVSRSWIKAWLIACNFQWSSWPVAIALGVGFNGFWPKQMFLTTIIGVVVYLSTRNHESRRVS